MGFNSRRFAHVKCLEMLTFEYVMFLGLYVNVGEWWRYGLRCGGYGCVRKMVGEGVDV